MKNLTLKNASALKRHDIYRKRYINPFLHYILYEVFFFVCMRVHILVKHLKIVLFMY